MASGNRMARAGAYASLQTSKSDSSRDRLALASPAAEGEKGRGTRCPRASGGVLGQYVGARRLRATQITNWPPVAMMVCPVTQAEASASARKKATLAASSGVAARR